MEGLKLSDSVFSQWDVRSSLLKSMKTRQTKTPVSHFFQILWPIQDGTMSKSMPRAFRKCVDDVTTVQDNTSKYMKYKIHSSLSVGANPWKSLLNFFPLYHRGEVGRGGGVPSERALQLGVHQTRWISPLPLANCHSIKSHTHFLPIIYCQIKPPFAVWLYHSGEKTNCLIISENSHNFHSNKTPLFFFLLVPTGVPLMIMCHKWSAAAITFSYECQ